MAFLLSKLLPQDPVLHGDEQCPEKLRLLRKLNSLMILLDLRLNRPHYLHPERGDAIKSMALPLLPSGISL